MTCSSRSRGAAACWSCSPSSPPAPTPVWAANRKETAMAVQLNHTIVPAHDPQASAQFLTDILGLPVDPPLAHFTPVTLANGVSLDFDRDDHVSEHHYAFQLSDKEFDAAFGRLRDRGVTHYADPACRQPGQVYAGKNGRRGTYFRDPDGHLMEILTPISGEPARGAGAGS